MCKRRARRPKTRAQHPAGLARRSGSGPALWALQPRGAPTGPPAEMTSRVRRARVGHRSKTVAHLRVAYHDHSAPPTGRSEAVRSLLALESAHSLADELDRGVGHLKYKLSVPDAHPLARTPGFTTPAQLW
eukprot:CAMPEP_0181214312 /NCGR_PEP_ID=MMETSP1096-20121128/25383_1 /TAXON_ID=156174 ORGANISM="Chrysochromulina ericina, Strain CCMP281" /NCGR_SAMPLE_ID=MMETSP1096 /ASSEMBLY_ACC=CAM_ASM_000453 /LENGTH=130 /DNA_ID=CAMNT_0023306033 /DNA_START=608 /DNA_END=1001 /DNA_ORIENTATION=-